MIRRTLVVGLTCIAFSSAALAQGSGGSGGGAGAASSGGGTSSANSGASATGAQAGQNNGASTTTTGNRNKGTEQREPNDSRAMTPAQRAQTGADTRPESETLGAVSAPGVGVGHSANGLPIGSPGSGLGSPEDPVDVKKR